MTKEIPIRRTGLVVFSSRIISIFTGIVFLVMMTRSLSAPQFGLWEVIIDLLTFASYPSGLLIFWATRDVARGAHVGKTALTVNLVMSGAGILIYFVLSLLSFRAVAGSLSLILLAVLLVPLSYWNQAANAIVSGHMPAVQGYSIIASELCKIAVAVPLLVIYRTGISGVILSMMVAYFAQALVSTYLVREASTDNVDLSVGRRWFANIWIPGLQTLPYILAIADTFVASVISGGTTVTAYYQAAFSIATIAGYSVYLASALYPVLLRGGSDEVVSTTLDLLLLFGIPMSLGAALQSTQILAFLKPQYAASNTGLVILSFAALISSVSSLLDGTLMGRDRVDLETATNFARYAKSDLLFVSVINISSSAVYLAAIGAVVAFGGVAGLPISQTVILWGAAQLLTLTAFMLVKLRRVRRTIKVHLKPSFWRYLFAALAMSVVVELVSGVLPSASGTVDEGSRLAVVALAAVVAYFGVLFGIDSGFRGLARSLLNSLK